jgi:hypothetical protein
MTLAKTTAYLQMKVQFSAHIMKSTLMDNRKRMNFEKRDIQLILI